MCETTRNAEPGDPGGTTVAAAGAELLAAVVTAMAPVGNETADADAAVTAAEACARLLSWTHAMSMLAEAHLAAVTTDAGHSRHTTLTSTQIAGAELAAALRISPRSGTRRIQLATQVVGRLPDLWCALAAGTIDLPRVRVVAHEVADLVDQDLTERVVQSVLGRAGQQTPWELRRATTRAALKADPRAAKDRHEQAMADRKVRITTRPDGMCDLWARLPAAGAMAIDSALTGLAATTDPDDDRTETQRRADVLVDLCTTALDRPDLTTPRRRRPHIRITVSASTLLGCDDQPADLAGYGPICAHIARAVAADGVWRRLLLDPHTGRLLDCGRTTYTPPAHLVDHVTTRDDRCRWPGCPHPAERSDLDHTTPWNDGGTTDPGNLAAVCRHHHRLKTHGGWRLEHAPDQPDGLIWTSPTGRRYETRPARLPTPTGTDPDPPF